MEGNMDVFRKILIEHEYEAEQLFLARHQVKEWEPRGTYSTKEEGSNNKNKAPSPFESLMKEVGGVGSKPLVREVCTTCGNHDSSEQLWMTFPGSDVFASVPFHAAHTILEKDQERLDFDSKKLQSCVKEKSLLLSEKGAMADRISPGVLRSLVILRDEKK